MSCHTSLSARTIRTSNGPRDHFVRVDVNGRFIVPLSRGLTRPLAALTEGVQRMSRGELDVQVAVPRGAELGKLASAFNQMAKDLRRHQQRMLEQERMRKELELSRRIQEELLPRQAVRLPFAEVAGASIPAREVGGECVFELPRGGPEPLLKALIDGGAGIETLSIERPGLHDAFVAIAGEAAAMEMGSSEPVVEAA